MTDAAVFFFENKLNIEKVSHGPGINVAHLDTINDIFVLLMVMIHVDTFIVYHFFPPYKIHHDL